MKLMGFQSGVALLSVTIFAVLISCKDSRLVQIAADPQTAHHRALAASAASIAGDARNQLENGGKSAGNAAKFGCQTRDYAEFTVTNAVRQKLRSLQDVSFATGVEHCGSVFIGESCQIQFSDTVRGTSHSCTQSIPSNMVRLASYHTHGVTEGANNGEIPSSTDFESAISFQTDGYVATPAGRLWRIDAFDQVATLVCRNCMPQDPNARYNKQIFQVGTRYRYVDIIATMRENGLVAGGQ